MTAHHDRAASAAIARSDPGTDASGRPQCWPMLRSPCIAMVHDREAARVADRELPHRGMHDDPTVPNGGFRPARRAWSLPGRPSSTVPVRSGAPTTRSPCGRPVVRGGLHAGRQRLGRSPPLTAEQVRQARALLTRPENSVAAIARPLGVSRSTRCTHIPDLGGGRWAAIEALQPMRSKGDV